jgi:8-oxo-dGTP pyrophosphatase MutT (NUDIX family)
MTNRRETRVRADEDALIQRISARLLDRAEAPPTGAAMVPDWMPERPFDRPPVSAAVLIGLVRRSEGLTVLYTERSASLRAHSGQVAFPGGKIEATDSGPAEAAVREAAEEVALEPDRARILGFMPLYFTGTNYLITPVVAVLEPARPFAPNPMEVEEVFEVPLVNLTREASYGTFRVRRNGTERTSWQIDHDGHRIWGITANLTRRFRDMALDGEEL